MNAIGPHLDDAAWEALAMGELTPAAREEALRHVTGCSSCAPLYRGILALEEGARAAGLDGVPGSAPPRRRWRWRAWWAGAGVLVTATAALLLWWRLPPDESRTTRGPKHATVELVAPREAVGAAPELVWRPVAGARRYRVKMFTGDGQPLFLREVDAPPLAWPDGVAAPPGDYRWKVEALGANGVTAESRLAEFRIAP